MIKKILLSIAVIIGLGFLAYPVYGQTIPGVSQWFYNVAGKYVYPVNSGVGVQIPSLGSTGNPCLSVNSSGNFATTTCGSGGGAITGTGVNGQNTYWTGPTSLGSSRDIFDNGTVSGVNATTSTINFQIQGTGINSAFRVSSSSGTSELTVSNSSNVGINTSTPTHRLDIYNTGAVTDGVGFLVNEIGNFPIAFQIQNNNALWQFSVRDSGDPNSGGFNFYSSINNGTSYVSGLGITTSGGILLPLLSNSQLVGTNGSHQLQSIALPLSVANGGVNTTTAPTTQGQILAYDGTAAYAPTTLIAGSNITITTTTKGSITLASTGGSATNPAGSNFDVQLNLQGSFGADTGNLIYSTSTKIFSTPVFSAASTTATSTIANALTIGTTVKTNDNLLFIQPQGTYSASTQNGGAINIDNSLNAREALVVYNGTNSIRNGGGGLIRIENASTTYSTGELAIDSTSTSGSDFDLRIISPNPDIEMYGSGTATTTNAYEIAIPTNQDVIQVNSRNAANNSFETIANFQAYRLGGRECIGCLTNNLNQGLLHIVGSSTIPYLTLGTAASNANILTINSTGLVGIGTSTPLDNLIVANNQNNQTIIRAYNNSNGSSANSSIFVDNGTSIGQLFKVGTGYGGYKTIQANDLGFLSSGGNIDILADTGSGQITFAAGGSSSAQLTLSSIGNVNVATLTASSLVTTDANKNLQSTIVGSQLYLNGQTLNSIPFVTYTVNSKATATGTNFSTIQAALTACGTAGGGQILLTDPTYTITSTLTFTGSGCSLIGNSINATVVNMAATGTSVALKTATPSSDFSDEVVENIQFNNTTATASGTAIDMSDMSDNLYSNLYIQNFGTAFRGNDTQNVTFYNHVDNVVVNNSVNINGGTQYFLNASSSKPFNDNWFSNVRVALKTTAAKPGICVQLDNAQANTFTNLNCEPAANTGSTGIKIYADSGANNNGTFSNIFNGVYIEGNATGTQVSGTVGTAVVYGNNFYGGQIETNTVNTFDSSNTTNFFGTGINFINVSTMGATNIVDPIANSGNPTFQIQNNTNFADNSSNFVRFQLQNGSDTANLLDLVNAGTGNTLIATTSTTSLVITSTDRLGINSTTPTALLTVTGVSGATTPLFIFASSTNQTYLKVDSKGHLVSGGFAPTVSSCGSTPNGTVTGTDDQGTITLGGTAPTACTLTFSVARTNNYSCQVDDNSVTVASDVSATSTTAVTFGLGVGGLAGGNLFYHCEEFTNVQ